MAEQLEGSVWRNRIVGRQDADPEQLMKHKDNWRIHPEAQAGAMAGILDEVGFVQDVIVNLRTDPSWGERQHHQVLIDGHMRVTLAVERKEPSVPVVYVDLNPEEEKLVLATFDPIGDMAVPDRVKLDEIAESAKADNPATIKLLQQLMADSGEVSSEGGEEVAKPEQLPDVSIEGTSTQRIRCIITFVDEAEVADFYSHFGREPEVNKVLWRYHELAASPVEESEVEGATV